MNGIKPIETQYKGYLFRSRLEARWAVFFDACGVSWEYEPEGYILPDGKKYLPDFLLHGVDGRAPSDLFVEVKGKMTPDDASKIYSFSGLHEADDCCIVKTPILVVSEIPKPVKQFNPDCYVRQMAYDGFPGFGEGPFPFNFETVDGDYYAAHPGINKNGRFELFGDDSNYLEDRDDGKTLRALDLARQARFEFGETPRVLPVGRKL